MLGKEPEESRAQQWKSFAHHWHSYNETSTPMQAYCFHMNEVFANCSDEDEIYPLIAEEIAEAQRADPSLKHLFKRNAVIDQGLAIKLIENTLAGNPQATPGVCSQMVSPLPTAPWTHTSQRDDECCNVLERYAYHHLVTNKVLQILPD
jgi:hypothetical protein